jgi:short-subunit dehydrogenase
MTTRLPSTPKRILLTGASRGIGRATAQQLARRGHELILASRDREALESLANELAAEGCKVEVLPMDVTDDANVQTAIDELLARGGCDVLINNAGSCDQAEFLLQGEDTRRAEMEVNYFGALRVARALLPSFIRRGSGTIVNVSSLLGSIPAATTANYSASKAALEAWSHALRGEVARFGVQVVVFVAPHTQTACGENAKFDGVRSLPVEYTAGELTHAVEHAPNQYAASPVYRVMLRVARWFPSFMHARVHDSVRAHLTPDPLAKLAASSY